MDDIFLIIHELDEKKLLSQLHRTIVVLDVARDLQPIRGYESGVILVSDTSLQTGQELLVILQCSGTCHIQAKGRELYCVWNTDTASALTAYYQTS